jgi:hypothetical protein
VPGVLSFITSKRWDAEVKGLDAFPQDEWPTNVPLLYYAFHIMVGLGTIFIAVMVLSFIQLRRGRLFDSKPMLWILMLAAPLPYVANTAGWMTAELGRQPWLIYGLMRTAEGSSSSVSSGNTMFTLLGFMGMYTLLLMLGLFMIWRELDHGPGAGVEPAAAPAAPIRCSQLKEGEWLCFRALVLDCCSDDRHVRRARRLRPRRRHHSPGRGEDRRGAAHGAEIDRPVWDGNEVWLLAGGGTLYFAFPALYASSFSGFYLPLMMVLWLLILRGTSVEFRSHIRNAVWRPMWDVIFSISSALLAIFFGAALGNVVRGVPLNDKASFSSPCGPISSRAASRGSSTGTRS